MPDRTATCAVCDTPLVLCGPAGWKHTRHFKDRDNCNIPWPGLPAPTE